jgi:hypothetical protein
VKVAAFVVHATNYIRSVIACNIHQTVWLSDITSHLNMGHTYFELRASYRLCLLKPLEVYRYLFTFQNTRRVSEIYTQPHPFQPFSTRLKSTFYVTLLNLSRTGIAQSVQRIATGWMVRGSNPGMGDFFRTCPDRPWGPLSLLYNGYRVTFPELKRPRRSVEPHTI